MTAAAAPVALLAAQDLERIVRRTCTSKRRFDNPAAARRGAFAARSRSGEAFRAYRCPFSGGTRSSAHWHIGRVPSLEALEEIAAAIRQRVQQTTAVNGERS